MRREREKTGARRDDDDGRAEPERTRRPDRPDTTRPDHHGPGHQVESTRSIKPTHARAAASRPQSNGLVHTPGTEQRQGPGTGLNPPERGARRRESEDGHIHHTTTSPSRAAPLRSASQELAIANAMSFWRLKLAHHHHPTPARAPIPQPDIARLLPPQLGSGGAPNPSRHARQWGGVRRLLAHPHATGR